MGFVGVETGRWVIVWLFTDTAAFVHSEYLFLEVWDLLVAGLDAVVEWLGMFMGVCLMGFWDVWLECALFWNYVFLIYFLFFIPNIILTKLIQLIKPTLILQPLPPLRPLPPLPPPLAPNHRLIFQSNFFFLKFLSFIF